MDILPMCEATSKQSGQRCKNFASKDKRVCRIHGGRSTGARTQEGKERQKKASWTHGRCSQEAKEKKDYIRELIRESRELIRGC